MSNDKTGKYRRIDFLIVIVYTVTMSGILLMELLLAEAVDYARKKEWYYSNPCYLLFGIGAIVLIALSVTIVHRFITSRKDFCRADFSSLNSSKIILFSVAWAFFQVYLISNYYFRTGWDVGSAILPAVETVARGNIPANWQNGAFSQYPNNLLLVFIFSVIRKIDLQIGILDVEVGIMCLVIVQCAVFAVTAYCLYSIILRLTNSCSFAWFGWLFYLAFIGLSPWISIPYSDSMGLLFPVLTLYFYLQYLDRSKNKYLFLLSAAGYLGFRIKPQASFIFIAVILSEGINAVREMRYRSLDSAGFGRIWQKIICILLALLMMLGLCSMAVGTMKFQLDESREFGWQHFFMMGLNSANDGGYNSGDVAFSRSFATKQERDDQNLKEACDRIQRYGTIGLLKHSARKILGIFSDGTFAWGQEGSFYSECYADRNNTISPTLKSIYYSDGARHPQWMNFVQSCWMVCLMGMSGVAFYGAAEQQKMALLRTMMIGVMGLVAFELLFEARARYLFTFTPIFVILAAVGWQGIFAKCCGFFKNFHGQRLKSN